MELFTLLFIAVGLAMDAFAVSITSGLAIKKLHIKHAFVIALSFGIFQAIMPLVGWLAGLSLRDFISGVDHWIAFGLLTVIGAKMIYESVKLSEDEKVTNPLNIYVLLVLSIATSIDALAVGVTFAFLKIFIATPAIIIGLVTFFLSFLGVYIGNKMGHFFENKIELLGGLILIAIGIKILIEHSA
ncbi:MAG: manganese efflux pump MntP family protein [Candidatus Hydrothermarchaeales archaeon]